MTYHWRPREESMHEMENLREILSEVPLEILVSECLHNNVDSSDYNYYNRRDIILT